MLMSKAGLVGESTEGRDARVEKKELVEMQASMKK